MKPARFLAYCAAFCLTACALTPEQRAAREAEAKRREQLLQIRLAEQCDADTAKLMRQQFFGTPANEAARREERLQYLDKINNPMFQSCYRMAWQNHLAQQELRYMQSYYHWREPYYYPWYRPFGFWDW